MATPQQPPETWYAEAIDLMIHERIPLIMAVTRLGAVAPPLTVEEASAHERRKAFKDLFRAATNKFYLDAAADVKEKDLLVGRMAANARTLENLGKHKDANDSLMAVAKIEGYVGGDTTININNETPAEIAEARKRLEAQIAAAKPTIQ